MGARYSINCKLYRNTGSYGSPTWSVVPTVKDVMLPLTKGEWDASTRASQFEITAPILIKAQLDFQIVRKTTTDAHLDALIAAFFASTQIEFAVMDGDIVTTGSKGLRASMEILKADQSQKLTEGVLWDFTVKPGDNDNAPSWLTI